MWREGPLTQAPFLILVMGREVSRTTAGSLVTSASTGSYQLAWMVLAAEGPSGTCPGQGPWPQMPRVPCTAGLLCTVAWGPLWSPYSGVGSWHMPTAPGGSVMKPVGCAGNPKLCLCFTSSVTPPHTCMPLSGASCVFRYLQEVQEGELGPGPELSGPQDLAHACRQCPEVEALKQ